MRVREYEPADAPALARIYVASVERLGSRDYSGPQVRAWLSLAPSAERIAELGGDGRDLLVAVDERGAPVAFGDLEADGHIHHLYASPDAAGRGAAAMIYDELEGRARAAGLRRLYSEASEAARRFLERRGFVVLGERRMEIAGVAIHNYAVEKRLDGGGGAVGSRRPSPP